MQEENALDGQIVDDHQKGNKETDTNCISDKEKRKSSIAERIEIFDKKQRATVHEYIIDPSQKPKIQRLVKQSQKPSQLKEIKSQVTPEITIFTAINKTKSQLEGKLGEEKKQSPQSPSKMVEQIKDKWLEKVKSKKEKTPKQNVVLIDVDTIKLIRDEIARLKVQTARQQLSIEKLTLELNTLKERQRETYKLFSKEMNQ